MSPLHAESVSQTVQVLIIIPERSAPDRRAAPESPELTAASPELSVSHPNTLVTEQHQGGTRTLLYTYTDFH